MKNIIKNKIEISIKNNLNENDIKCIHWTLYNSHS